MAILGTLSLSLASFDPRGRGRMWLTRLLLLFLAGPSVGAPVPPSREYQVKAVFLFNFAQFVEWPPSAFPDPQAPIVIGILGEDPFGPFLDETVRDEKIDGRVLVVRRFRQLKEIDRCQILFVSPSEAANTDGVLAGLKDRQILTVGESSGFAKHGGMIRFITENNKIRLRINLGSATAAGLKLSSKLLRPAEIIGNPEN